MGDLTLSEIGIALTFLVGLITGIGFLYSKTKGWIEKLFKEEFKPLNEKMDNLSKRIDDVDLGAVKNYLVSYLSDIEKNEKIDEIEKERFFEQYEHYQKIGGNSYIKHKVDKLKNEGKI